MSEPIKHPKTEISTCDPVWNAVQRDAEAMRLAEPALSSLLHENVLGRPTFEAALAARIAAAVVPLAKAPALSSDPSMPSVSAASVCRPSSPSSARASAS